MWIKVIKVPITVDALGVNRSLSVRMHYFALSSHFTLPVAVRSVCGGELGEPVFCSFFYSLRDPSRHIRLMFLRCQMLQESQSLETGLWCILSKTKCPKADYRQGTTKLAALIISSEGTSFTLLQRLQAYTGNWTCWKLLRPPSSCQDLNPVREEVLEHCSVLHCLLEPLDNCVNVKRWNQIYPFR